MYDKHWTPTDDDTMRTRYPLERASQALADTLHRTVKAVQQRARTLGLTGQRAPRWTPEQDALLRAHYHKASREELMALFPGRVWQGVLTRAHRLELTIDQTWSPDEDQAIRDWYPDGRWKLLHARLPGRSSNAIHSHAQVLGVGMKPEARRRNECAGHARIGRRHIEPCGKVLGSVVQHAADGAASRKLPAPLLDGSRKHMEYLDSLASDTCALSGLPLTYRTRARCTQSTASLDRIDSTKGYIEGNVQWVHKAINAMKSNMNEETFISLCTAVAKYRGGLS